MKSIVLHSTTHRLAWYLGCLLLGVFTITGCGPSKTITTNTTVSVDLLKFETDRDAALTFKKIASGKTVTLEINNVNKDLYDVTIDTVKTTNNTDIPTAFSAISLPAQILFGIGSQKSAGQIEKGEKGIENYSKDFAEKMVVLDSCSANINRSMIPLKAAINTDVSSFQNALDGINSTITFYNYMDVLKKSCDHSVEKLQNHLKQAAKIFDNTIDTSSSLHVVGTKMLMSIQTTIAEAKRKYASINFNLNIIDTLVFYNTCSEEERKSIKDFSEREKENLANIKAAYDKVVEYEQGQMPQLLVQRLESFDKSNFTVSSSITANEADQITFRVGIKPKNWLPCKAVTSNFTFPLAVSGGLKVDFSTGLFLNFGNSNFRGLSYYIDSSATIRQIKNSGKALIPSLGALAHLYLRSGEKVDAGLTAGASVTTDLKASNFHLGASLLLNTGNTLLNRMALSAGATWHYVEELIPGYHEGIVLDKSLTLDQLKQGKYRQGWFLALTYNLTPSKKE